MSGFIGRSDLIAQSPSLLSDRDLVARIQENPQDQRAWREVYKRTHDALRSAVYRRLGAHASSEDAQDAISMSHIEVRRRLLGAKVVGDREVIGHHVQPDAETFCDCDEHVLGTDGDDGSCKSLRLPSFAAKVGAPVGVREVRRQAYGPDYETIIVPALKLRGCIAEGFTHDDACRTVGISAQRGHDVLAALNSKPILVGPETIPDISESESPSAEYVLDNHPEQMLAAVERLFPDESLRKYVVVLAGSREYIGDSIDVRETQKACGIDQAEHRRRKVAVIRSVRRALNLESDSAARAAGPQVLAVLRGEAVA